jgi:ABC-type uncharacterized transport system substrate-binding protein
LRELGWIEGRNIAIEYRWSAARPERAAEIAAELGRQKVDVIVTTGLAAAAVKQATPDTPIVFATANDPIGGGLVTNLSRPGGNVTGLSNQSTDLASKRLELLREITGRLHLLAIMVDVGFVQAALEMNEVQDAARTFGVEIVRLEVRRAEDIAPAFAALKVPADALYVMSDALLNANSTRIVTLALSARLPTIFNNRSYVESGGLLSYGPNIMDQYRRSADYVDKILRGTNPGDIPVEQPTKFELVINLKTARALGLTVPQTLLATADQVIE